MLIIGDCWYISKCFQLPSSPPVWQQSCPVKLMTATTSHVVATAIFDDGLATSWAAFHRLPQKHFHILLADWSSLAAGNPLVLTHEAHHRIRT
jgi:hypothetical protein